MAAQPQMISTAAPSEGLAAMRLTILLIKTGGSFIIGALMGLDWAELSGQQKFLIIVAGIVALATAVEAFNDKTMSRLADGKAATAAGKTPPLFELPARP